MSVEHSDNNRPASKRTGMRRLEPAVALLAIAFSLLLVFQTVQLTREGGSIRQLRAAQEPIVQEGLRLRAQLNSIAGKTAALADAGNASAKAIIEDIRK